MIGHRDYYYYHVYVKLLRGEGCTQYDTVGHRCSGDYLRARHLRAALRHILCNLSNAGCRIGVDSDKDARRCEPPSQLV